MLLSYVTHTHAVTTQSKTKAKKCHANGRLWDRSERI